MANGTGWVVKSLFGVGASAVIAVTTFNGTKIDRNKDTNEAQHIAIVETVEKKYDKLQSDFSGMRVEQAVQGEILRRIEKKL